MNQNNKIDRGNEFSQLSSFDSIVKFLSDRGMSHIGGYYHYTTIDSLKGMLKSKKLHLSLGRRMNDLLEIQNCDPKAWNSLYVVSFSYGSNENMALWGIYGNPFPDAVRIKFYLREMKQLLSSTQYKIYRFNKDDKQNPYTPLLSAKSEIKLVDVAYEHKKNLRWNHMSNFQLKTYNVPEMIGMLKNAAWEYENEVRILIKVYLDEEKSIPETIAIDCEKILKRVVIMGGPCLSRKRLCNELKDFTDIISEDNLMQSQSYGKVHFREKCKTCEIKQSDCPLYEISHIIVK